MRIAVVGAGPAGLYFARHAKLAMPDAQIRVYEQNVRGTTYGFGVVIADRGLTRLQKADPETMDAIMSACFVSRHRVISHEGESIFVEGGGYGAAIGRQRLLDILQGACERIGVEIAYGERVEDVERLHADLIVGADGVNSIVRHRHSESFGETSRTLTNKLAWYGTTQHFPYPLLTFKQWKGNLFWAVGYAYTEGMGTFVAECDEAAWVGCGLDRMTDDERRALVETVFVEELGGKPLISNRSFWTSLRVVRSRRWSVGRCVLLGDALHSAHPSIGSGTRIAMEDSVALVEAVVENADVDVALAAFERARAPAKQKLIDAMDLSIAWYENLPSRLGALNCISLVFEFITRTGRLDDARLVAEFPHFMDKYREQRRAFPTRSPAAGENL